MASRRQLKKSINNLTFELISECYVYNHFHKSEKTEKKVESVIEDLVKKRNELIEKVNHPDNKTDKKIYATIKAELTKMIDLMDKLS